MKTLRFWAASALLLGTFALSRPAGAAVTVDFFYENLEPHGEWLEVADYGYAWHPREIADEWRPYTLGSWAYTDAGWTWVSDEPFGWITYHYGRWVRVVDVGWVWVPDTEWAPAWVSWRRSNRYVGWAPLPPEADFRVEVGFSNWVDSYYEIGPTAYAFVEVERFGAPRIASVIVEPRRNLTIIQETRNITQINYVNNIVVNLGPQYDVIVRQSREPIRRLRLDRQREIRADRRGERLAARIQGETLFIPAPEIQQLGEARPRQVARRIERAEVNRGWRDAGPREQVEQLRARVRDEAKAPEQLGPRPARIARDADDQKKPGSTARDAHDPAMRRDQQEKGATREEQPVVGTPPAEGQPETKALGTRERDPEMRRDGRKGSASETTTRNPRGETKGESAADPQRKTTTSDADANHKGRTDRPERSGEERSGADAERKGRATQDAPDREEMKRPDATETKRPGRAAESTREANSPSAREATSPDQRKANPPTRTPHRSGQDVAENARQPQRKAPSPETREQQPRSRTQDPGERPSDAAQERAREAQARAQQNAAKRAEQAREAVRQNREAKQPRPDAGARPERRNVDRPNPGNAAPQRQGNPARETQPQRGGVGNRGNANEPDKATRGRGRD